jgi:hypothetical protein
MKSKNPLYVVKGQDVLEAKSFIDLLLKKWNIGPTWELLQNLINVLLEQINSYAYLEVINTYLNHLIESFQQLIKRLNLA